MFGEYPSERRSEFAIRRSWDELDVLLRVHAFEDRYNSAAEVERLPSEFLVLALQDKQVGGRWLPPLRLPEFCRPSHSRNLHKQTKDAGRTNNYVSPFGASCSAKTTLARGTNISSFFASFNET